MTVLWAHLAGTLAVTCRCTPIEEEAGICLNICLLEAQIQIISVLVTDVNCRILGKTEKLLCGEPVLGLSWAQQLG